MLGFLFKKIPYNHSFKKHLLIGGLLGGIVIFIMTFLQPFGTFGFESDYKYLIFFGFGLLLFIIYSIWSRIENLWYDRNGKGWEVKDELVSFVLFMLVSTIPIHFYNQVFLNDFFNSKDGGITYIKHGLWFFQNSLMPIMAILLPFYIYLRNTFGELITPDDLNKIHIYGANKDEQIAIVKEALLFIKASENYVDIYYTKNDTVQHKTFRNTLTGVSKQVPFLRKSHRSYLVNISAIKMIKGNSQNAKIAFQYSDLEVPLSKSYYKSIKLALGI